MLLGVPLLFFPSAFFASAFPYGRCQVRSCDVSPYGIVLTSSTKGSFCFRLVSKECVDSSRFNCCNLFRNTLTKISLSGRPECNRTVSSVTVNGVRKGGGVFFDSYQNPTFGELRLTTLRMNETAVGSVFCVNVTSPCDTFEKFCMDDCMYSVFDSAGHTCCPTCNITAENGFVRSLPPLPISPLPRPNPPPPLLNLSPPSPRPPTPNRNPPPPSSPPPNSSPGSEMTCNCTCIAKG